VAFENEDSEVERACCCDIIQLQFLFCCPRCLGFLKVIKLGMSVNKLFRVESLRLLWTLRKYRQLVSLSFTLPQLM